MDRKDLLIKCGFELDPCNFECSSLKATESRESNHREEDRRRQRHDVRANIIMVVVKKVRGNLNGWQRMTPVRTEGTGKTVSMAVNHA